MDGPFGEVLVYVKNCALGENAHGLIAKARSLWHYYIVTKYKQRRTRGNQFSSPTRHLTHILWRVWYYVYVDGVVSLDYSSFRRFVRFH